MLTLPHALAYYQAAGEGVLRPREYQTADNGLEARMMSAVKPLSSYKCFLFQQAQY